MHENVRVHVNVHGNCECVLVCPNTNSSAPKIKRNEANNNDDRCLSRSSLDMALKSRNIAISQLYSRYDARTLLERHRMVATPHAIGETCVLLTHSRPAMPQYVQIWIFPNNSCEIASEHNKTKILPVRSLNKRINTIWPILIMQSICWIESPKRRHRINENNRIKMFGKHTSIWYNLNLKTLMFFFQDRFWIWMFSFFSSFDILSWNKKVSFSQTHSWYNDSRQDQ